MKNIGIPNNNYPLLQKISTSKMQDILEVYVKFLAAYKYVRYILFGAVLVIFVYNFFYVGKQYTMGEYTTIRNTFVSILMALVAILIILLVVILKRLAPLKRALKQEAQIQSVTYMVLKKEFNAFIKETLRGVPI